MRPDRFEWPKRENWVDIAWVAFALANLAAMALIPTWETVPFHFIWVSLTLLYGFRVWRMRPTMWVLGAVMASTATLIWIDVTRGAQPADELTEVPLMAAMFLAMVWHARRRLAAMEEIERVSGENLRLLERERRFVQDASHELRTPITVAPLGTRRSGTMPASSPTSWRGSDGWQTACSCWRGKRILTSSAGNPSTSARSCWTHTIGGRRRHGDGSWVKSAKFTPMPTRTAWRWRSMPSSRTP